MATTKSDLCWSFFDRLKIALKKQGLEQKDLADKLGINKGQISKWKHKPPFRSAKYQEIAEILNCNPIWLRKGKQDDIESFSNEELHAMLNADETVKGFEIAKDNYVIPVIEAYTTNENQFMFFCNHCNCWHTHSNYEGHATAHCYAKNSPFKPHGYSLKATLGDIDSSTIDFEETSPKLCPKCTNYYSVTLNTCQCGYIDQESENNLHKDIKNFYRTRIPSLKKVVSQTSVKLTETPESIATGEGNPFPPEPDQTTTTEQNGNLVKVIFLEDTYASAGKGLINYDDAPKVMTFDKTFLSMQLGITSYENLHIITAIGDSMADKIKSGDLLFVNPGEIDVVTGAVYVFLVGEDVLVKRAEKNPLNGNLTLRSDNTTYAPIDLEGEDMAKVKVIGRVIGTLSKL